MLEVFRKILTFPAPLIDFNEFLDLIDGLDAPQLQQEKQAKIATATQKNLNLKLWVELAKEVLSFWQLIHRSTKQIDKTTTADDLLPVLIELLPKYPEDLKAIQANCEQMINLLGRTYLNYFFTTLHSATFFVLESKSTVRTELSYSILCDAIITAEREAEIEMCKTQLQPILQACIECKSYLYPCIADYIRLKFPVLYETYFNVAANQDENIKNLARELQDKTITAVEFVNDQALLHAIEKYMAVLTIFYPLNNSKPTRETMTTFAEAFAANSEILNKSMNLVRHPTFITQSVGYVNSTRLITLFRPCTPEEKFSQLAEPFSQMIRKENELVFRCKQKYLVMRPTP